MTEEERAYQACRDREHLSRIDEFGRTLLHTAAHAGKAAICRIYINAGIDPSAKDNSGRTAADLAKAAGYASLARSLEASITQRTSNGNSTHPTLSFRLLDALEQRGLISGEATALERIIIAGRMNSRNAKGDTPLHLAAAGGHLGMCNKLFEAGADATAKNNAHQTAADMAADAGHSHLANLLRGLEAGIPLEPASETAGTEIASKNSTPPNPSDFIVNGALDCLVFDGEEDPGIFHSRQGIAAVSATFEAIPSGSGLRSGATEDNDEWELPGSLARVREADAIGARLRPGRDLPNENVLDFAHSTGRSSRQPQKLRNTRFRLSEDICLQWSRDALAAGKVGELAIQDLVGSCQGNHVPADLIVNVRKILDAAGFLTEEPLELQVFEGSVDADDLGEAIHAICNRDIVVPGCQAFTVDRVTEERLVREIANARHQLLNAVLDSSELLSEIIRQGESVLTGENAPDTFTDLDIDVTDDDDSVTEFSANLHVLRDALVAGIEVGGRARRKAIEALDELEVSHSCLKELADQIGSEAGSSISRLLSAYNRSTEEFLLAHLPFARRETAKMAALDEDPEELFQEAYFAMRRATERFDPERGVRFYIYALYWIRQQIDRWRKNNRSMIRVPVHRCELHSKIVSFTEEFQQTYLRPPSKVEVSEALGCEVRVITQLELALSEPLEFSEAMESFSGLPCSSEEFARSKQAEELIKREIDGLDEREGKIIRMRFGIGLESDMTLEEVGQIYGVTRERIRQIEAKALGKLSHPARARFLRGLL